MCGAPDNVAIKRAAPTSVEYLRAQTAATPVPDVQAESGTMALAWVGMHDGQFVADWARPDGDVAAVYSLQKMDPRDKNEQVEPTWEEELEKDEWCFYPSDKDEQIATTMGGSSGEDHGGEAS